MVDAETSGDRLQPQGRGPSRALVRPFAAASRADLVGRSVWTLSNAADGFGDATISLARIATGSMNAHAHAPGGEFMFVIGGRGRIWIEGLPLRLDAGMSLFIPPGLLHNAENTEAADLMILGITAPGMVPGSYPEVPPLFAPTGRITGLDAFVCKTSPDVAPLGASAACLDPASDEGLSVRVRLVTVDPGVTVSLDRRTDRGWVAIGGTGSFACGAIATRPLSLHDTCLTGPGTIATFTASRSGLTLLEVRHPAAAS